MKFRKNEMLLIAIFLVGILQMQAQEGTITITGNVTLSSSASYECQIKDLSGAGVGHDQVVSTGNTTLGGTLNIALDGYTPATGDQFELMSYSGTLSGTFATINWPAAMTSQGWLIDYGVLSPGKVTIYGPTSPLPIELINFSVVVQAYSNLITWQTASEINNAYFDVERSDDGHTFHSVGRVEGAGNSSVLEAYRYEDQNLISDHNILYYRLKQVDIDGHYTYSTIKVASRKGAKDNIVYYPNPTSGIVHFSDPVEQVVIYDATGQVVLRKIGRQDQVDLQHLIPGIYYIEINQSTERKAISINK